MIRRYIAIALFVALAAANMAGAWVTWPAWGAAFNFVLAGACAAYATMVPLGVMLLRLERKRAAERPDLSSEANRASMERAMQATVDAVLNGLKADGHLDPEIQVMVGVGRVPPGDGVLFGKVDPKGGLH